MQRKIFPPGEVGVVNYHNKRGGGVKTKSVIIITLFFYFAPFPKRQSTHHNVIVDAAEVHHVERVEVHLQPSLLPVRRLLPPGLEAEHGHQQTWLRELRSTGVTTEL